MKYHSMPIRMATSQITDDNAGEDVEQWELAVIAGWDAKW